MARRIFVILAFILALNLGIPIVNAISPFSPGYTSQSSNDLTTAKVINAVGCKPSSLTGTVTAATSGSLTDNRQIWSTNQWTGASVKITSGLDSGDSKSIVTNTPTALTISGNFVTTPSVGDGYTIVGTTGGSDYSCSASVGGAVGQNSILGPIVNTILVFGNFFAAASFLVQIAGGIAVPSYYLYTWMSASCNPTDIGCLSVAFSLSGLYQAVAWFAYADAFFYIISGRDILG
ncbi:MAG: hypothetical protein OK436_01605 [Thaumarchaeota archaeon]|nr:hypothetical protein [Nitrososphaerota archaeon]